MTIQPHGNHPGTDLAFFIELEFRGHIRGQHRDLDHVSRRLPTAEEGYCLRRELEANRLNLSPPSPIKVIPVILRKFLRMASSSPAAMYHH